MKRIPATISQIDRLTQTLIGLEVQRRDGRPFPYFLPGQYATVSFPRFPRLRGERSFSIATSPTDLSRIGFGIRVGGQYTRGLAQMKPGEPIDIGGPYGHFTFDPLRDRSAVFIAGGIGITPMLSMLRFATAERLPNELLLIYSVRSMAEAAYYDELEAMVKRNPNLRVVYAVGDGKVPMKSNRFIAGRVSHEALDKALEGVLVGSTYFLCGPPPFMRIIHKQLLRLGVPMAEILSERFSVGSTDLIERGSMIPKFMMAAGGALAVVMIGMIFRVEQNRRTTALYIPPATTSNTDTAPLVNSVDSSSANTNIGVTSAPATNTNIDSTTPVPTPTPTQTYTPPTYSPPVQYYQPSPQTRVS